MGGGKLVQRDRELTTVPLPTQEEADQVPPDRDEIRLICGGVHTNAAPDSGWTELQHVLMGAMCEGLSGFTFDPAWYDDVVTPMDLARGLARRDQFVRARILQQVVLHAMVVTPTPPEVVQRIGQVATALGVDDHFLGDVEKYGPESYDAALIDFARNGYAGDFTARHRPVLGTERDIGDGWGVVDDDPGLAGRWARLEDCSTGSLGRDVWEFYVSRGFMFPGSPGSAPPLLAQHDWVHVLADYGTTLQNELEVFAFIARADDDPRGFSLLAMVIGLFETGAIPEAGGLFEASAGHLSVHGMATRLADAMRRGALARPDGDVAKAFLAVDWFDYADLPLEEVRRRFGIPDKSDGALAAGSVGPWHPDGISAFQRDAGDPILQARIAG
ncbi:hypothetical protein [Salsipaludibacter albus]|uniref:hypothetical protein n=1 Tax=Salsipaludibacter albus TaxID=2849650 RepID=UPI001EE44393|nr:hypothetical protein [Salsipaludibacter albus]MBY5162384.1 hypothetical protein [Salsipaludibacter albus]